jgi:amino-acid N-acetyltransferase
MPVADLRGILHYVPQFKNQTFIVAVDGAILSSAAQAQLMVDLASLHSLDIRIILVFGARHQVEETARRQGICASDLDGTGPTDDLTLEVCLSAISRLSAELMRSLTTVGLRAAAPNSISAYPAGIIGGVDQIHTGRIENVDARGLRALLDDGIIPLIQPLTYDRTGQALRLNSDAVAIAIGRELAADKVLFLTEDPCPRSLTPSGNGQVTAIEADSLAARIQEEGNLYPSLVSKLRHASRACSDNVSRVHIIDAKDPESLLSELFSNEGIGIMVHADEYLLIRAADEGDIPEILTLIEGAMAEGEIALRSREDLAVDIGDFFLLEVDGNPIGCAALHQATHSAETAELACLFVRRSHKGQGHGARLIAHAEQKAREQGASRLVVLTTQARGFFQKVGGFSAASISDLPTERRKIYEASGRKSAILLKELA